MVGELKLFVLLVVVFLIFYFVPFDAPIVSGGIVNGFKMLNEYAREHVLLCLVPAFFIAGTISVMLKKDAVLKLLGPDAKRYGMVATILAAIMIGLIMQFIFKEKGTDGFVDSTSDVADSIKVVVFFPYSIAFHRCFWIKDQCHNETHKFRVTWIKCVDDGNFCFRKTANEKLAL